MVAVERSHRATAFRRAVDDVADSAWQQLRRRAPRAGSTILTQRDDEPSTTADECADAIACCPSWHSRAMKENDPGRIDISRGYPIGAPLHHPENGTIADPECARQENRAGRWSTRTFNEENAYILRRRDHEVKDVVDLKSVIARRSAHANSSPCSRVGHGHRRERHGSRAVCRKRYVLRFHLAPVELERHARSGDCALT